MWHRNNSVPHNFYKGDNNMILNELSIVDYIINKITTHKYPQESSVVNDTLRLGLSKAYGINLNMLDTVKIPIEDKNGNIVFFYAYSGPKENIDKIYSTLSDNRINKEEILGIYPDGILIGFFPIEFCDIEYRKIHIIEYAMFVFHVADIVGKYYKVKFFISNICINVYSWYLDSLGDIYAARSIIQLNEDIDLETIQNSLPSEYYDSDFTFVISNTTIFYYALKNKKDFMDAASLVRNGEYYNFFSFYLKESKK